MLISDDLLKPRPYRYHSHILKLRCKKQLNNYGKKSIPAMDFY